MKHIELSGFGINCKSSIVKSVCKKIPNCLPIMSDSEIINDMYSRYWASWDPEERCRFRYHQIESMFSTFSDDYHLLIDRGIVDQIVFARMIDSGFIKRTVWIEEGFGCVNEDYGFIDDYIPFELKYPVRRFFIYTQNESLVRAILSDEKAANVEKRSYFSKSSSDYFRLQEEFFRQYKSIIPECEVLFIENDVPVSESVNKIVERLCKELS